MLHLVSKVLIVALALLLAANFIPGIVVSGIYVAIISAVVLGFLNLIVKPILVILTLPVNILTLGLFTFVINALLFWFAASFIDGFIVDGFVPALLGSILVSVVSAIGSHLLE